MGHEIVSQIGGITSAIRLLGSQTPADTQTTKAATASSEWVQAKDLQIGDLILTEDGNWIRVTNSKYYDVETTKVYNLEVEDNHSYVVGELGVVVHNYPTDFGFNYEGMLRAAVNYEAAGIYEAGKEHVANMPKGAAEEFIKQVGEYKQLAETVGGCAAGGAECGVLANALIGTFTEILTNPEGVALEELKSLDGLLTDLSGVNGGKRQGAAILRAGEILVTAGLARAGGKGLDMFMARLRKIDVGRKMIETSKLLARTEKGIQEVGKRTVWEKMTDPFNTTKRSTALRLIRSVSDDVKEIEATLNNRNIKLPEEVRKSIRQNLTDRKNALTILKSGATKIDGLRIIGGKVEGKIPLADFLRIRRESIKNPNSKTFTLGRYEPGTNGKPASTSYNRRAGKTSHFDLGEYWNSISQKFNLTPKEMFSLFNRPALDDAIRSGKRFRFSHDPRTVDEIKALAQEWKYLQKHGYTDLVPDKSGKFLYAEKPQSSSGVHEPKDVNRGPPDSSNPSDNSLSGSAGSRNTPTPEPSSPSTWDKIKNWLNGAKNTENLNGGTGPLRNPARKPLINEDILIGSSKGLQSSTSGVFENIKFGNYPSPDAKYLWTIDSRGVNVALEKTPMPTPRGHIVHTNLSSRASIGGEAWFGPNNTVTINAGSGRFGDGAGISKDQWKNAINYWKSLGYNVNVIPYGSR